MTQRYPSFFPDPPKAKPSKPMDPEVVEGLCGLAFVIALLFSSIPVAVGTGYIVGGLGGALVGFGLAVGGCAATILALVYLATDGDGNSDQGAGSTRK